MDFYTNYRSSNSREERALFSAQISSYDNSNNEYLVSSATQDPFKKDHLSEYFSRYPGANATMKRSSN
jgi:hypothetical protein